MNKRPPPCCLYQIFMGHMVPHSNRQTQHTLKSLAKQSHINTFTPQLTAVYRDELQTKELNHTPINTPTIFPLPCSWVQKAKQLIGGDRFRVDVSPDGLQFHVRIGLMQCLQNLTRKQPHNSTIYTG